VRAYQEETPGLERQPELQGLVVGAAVAARLAQAGEVDGGDRRGFHGLAVVVDCACARDVPSWHVVRGDQLAGELLHRRQQHRRPSFPSCTFHESAEVASREGWLLYD
jgi:uncharacterized Ntn-hydrolase superfamily protein